MESTIQRYFAVRPRSRKFLLILLLEETHLAVFILCTCADCFGDRHTCEVMSYLPKLLALHRVNSRVILALKNVHFWRNSRAHSLKGLPSFTSCKVRLFNTNEQPIIHGVSPLMHSLPQFIRARNLSGFLFSIMSLLFTWSKLVRKQFSYENCAIPCAAFHRHFFYFALSVHDEVKLKARAYPFTPKSYSMENLDFYSLLWWYIVILSHLYISL